MKKILVIIVLIATQLTSNAGFALALEASQAAMLQTETGDLIPGLEASSSASVSPVADPVIAPLLKDTPSPTVNPKFKTAVTADSSALVRKVQMLRKLARETFSLKEKINFIIDNATGGNITAKVFDHLGNEVKLPIQAVLSENATILRLLPTNHITPGKYMVEIYDGNTKVSTQDFTWGVLALNTNKATYAPQETAKIAIGVLDEEGQMVCDADVTLRIANTELNTNDLLSTENGKIQVNPECLQKGYTEKPDYEATYLVGKEGEYTMTLTARTKNGTYSIEDSFFVKTAVPFVIERESATRIYPAEAYPVSLTITAQKEFTGTVTETVPDIFAVNALDGVMKYSQVRSVSTATITKEEVLGASVQLSMPFSDKHTVSSGFSDELIDASLKKKYFEYGLAGHDGIDFDMPAGTPVLATDEGVVALAKENSDYGTTVVLQHKWGKSYYGHLSSFAVKVGEKVKRGEEIAKSGNTGLATAAHLHFGIKPNENDMQNGYYGKVDPAPFLGLSADARVLAASTSRNEDSQKVLTWNVSMKKGETIKLGYKYKAPEISPQFYTIGPLRFFEKGKGSTFEEARVWQIAVDDIAQGDGMLTYGKSGSNDLLYRTWTNSASSKLGAESSAVTEEATIRWTVTKASPVRNEIISVSLIAISTTDTSIVTSRFNGTSWSVAWCLSTVASKTYGGVSCTQTSSIPTNANTAMQGVDLAYEKTTGNALVVWSRNAAGTSATAYNKWNGTSWSGATTMTTTFSLGVVSWVQLESKPTSGANEIIGLFADANADLWGSVWSGGTSPTWTERSNGALETTLEPGVTTNPVNKAFDGAYESISGDFVVVWGYNNAAGVRYIKRSTAIDWTSGATTQFFTSDIASVLDLAPDPGSNKMALVTDADAAAGNTTDDPMFNIWNGSGFDTASNCGLSANSMAAGGQKTVGAGWLSDGTNKRAVAIVGSTGTSISYCVYNDNTSTWGASVSTFAAGATSAITSPVLTVQNPFNVARFAAFVGKSTQLRALDFSIAAGTITVSDGLNPAASVATLATTSIYQPFGFTYNQFIPVVALNQAAYRWYDNDNATTVTTAKAAQDTVATLTSDGEAFRLRMAMDVTSAQLSASGQTFKLQYAQKSGTCDTSFTGETYADVGGSGSLGPTITGTGTSNGGGATPWSNPTNITTSNDGNASVTSTNIAQTEYLKATNFGFAVPTGATIDGIKVQYERQYTSTGSSGVTDTEVKIIKGGTVGTTNKAGVAWTKNTDTLDSYGSTTDLWGESWTAADINSSTFGVALSANVGDELTSYTATVDSVQITVYYSVTVDIAYKNNTTPTDGASLTANGTIDPTYLGHTKVSQTYEEANNFTNSVALIPSGQFGLWDFALYDMNAPASTSYCFRVVKSDDSLLDTYTVIPEITTASGGAPTTLNLQVNAADNDGADVAGSSTFRTTGKPEDAIPWTDITHLATGGKDAGPNVITTGFRFTNVTIPQGATITSATFDLREAWGGNYASNVKTKIYASKQSDVSAVFSNSNLPRDITKTTASVDWDSTTTVGTTGTWYSTTSSAPGAVTALIQEVVNQGTWSAGNSIAIIVTDDGSTASWWWEPQGYESGAANAAKLSITYTSSSTPTNDQLMRHGKWFNNGVRQPFTF